jgi:hypothetical protein
MGLEVRLPVGGATVSQLGKLGSIDLIEARM